MCRLLHHNVILVFAVGLTLLTACWGRGGDREQAITDVRIDSSLLLEKRPHQDHIYALSIRGEGEIAGEAELVLGEASVASRRVVLSGPVDFEWYGDWYADDANLEYHPRDVTGGRLTLHYRFHD